MDRIRITNLDLRTHIGIPDEERAGEQRITVSLDLSVRTKEAATSDDIAQTVDYEKLSDALRTIAKEERRTLEKFAEDVAMCALGFDGAASVTVTVKKYPPIGAESVAITITRP